VVVYLTLAAQYESYVFIGLLAMPVALLGALGAQALRGLQNDVYCQIGLVDAQIAATTLNLLFIPVLYVIVRSVVP
jgi:AcrB/AcrD/AcrF family